ncbi:hypothetical protein D9M68_541650 [compost metagenome]
MRGRDADHARLERDAVHAQAFVVGRHRDHLRAGGQHRLAQRGIEQLLDRHHRAPRHHQDARQQPEGLLRAGRDHDVVGRAADRARERHMRRDRLAQGALALGVGVVGGLARHAAQRAVGQAAPDVERKGADIGQADAEVVARGPRLQRGGEVGAGHVQRHQPRIAPGRGARLLGRGPAAPQRGQRVGHVGAGARARQQVALAQQQVVGRQHGVARHAQPLRQRARGGQAGAGLQPAVEDGVAQLAVQRAQQVARTGDRQAQGKLEKWLHDLCRLWFF